MLPGQRTHARTHTRTRASRQRADLRRTARQRTSEGLPAHDESVQYDGCHAGRERQVLQRVVLHGASDISQPVESRPRHAACPPDGKMRSGRTTVMRIVRPTRRLSRASPRSSTRPGRSSGTATEGVEDHGARGKGLQMLSQRGDILHVADMVHQENSPSVENAPRAPIAAPGEARSRGEIVAREGGAQGPRSEPSWPRSLYMSSSSERAPPGCYWTALPRRPGPVSGRTGARRKKVTKWTNRPFCHLFHFHQQDPASEKIA